MFNTFFNIIPVFQYSIIPVGAKPPMFYDCMARVIAIDGPSGAGKGTVAKKLSETIGFEYLDTGALYRAVALKLLNEELNENTTDKEIKKILKNTLVNFIDGKIYLDKQDITNDIRTERIGHYSSVFSARKVVRDFLMGIQRNAAENRDIIAEGRDMTTVVFPDAWKKIFLTADVDVRAKRRYCQLKEKSDNITIDDAMRDIAERDSRDSTRTVAPLKKADDAVLLNNSGLSIEETIEKLLEMINKGE